MSYNELFIFFVIISALISVLAYLLSENNGKKLDKAGFVILSTALVGFVTLRPVGVGLDDINVYLKHFDSVCPSLQCLQFIQGRRDIVWFSLVGLLKSIRSGPEVMLWVAGFGLTVKLFAIYRLCSNLCISLLVYVSLFYIIHDITAFRVSFALSIYLFGFMLIARGVRWFGGLVLMLCGFFHQQAFVSPLLILTASHPKQWKTLVILIMGPFLLLAVGAYPSPYVIKSIMEMQIGMDFLHIISGFQKGYFSEIQRAANGAFSHIKPWPSVVPPTLVLASWISMSPLADKRDIVRLASCSIVIASFFLWFYAFYPGMQSRFWEYFLVPIVFIVGNARLSSFKLIAILAVSGVYVVKYTVMHSLLIDQWQVH